MLKSAVELNPTNTYIVACSFGPDSMALLNFLFESEIKVVAAHVNYHKRDASNYEEESLVKYCQQRKIPCEVLDTRNLKCVGNFQQWARQIRYDFFKKIADKYQTNKIVVAHQKDDFIETYLMQKKRGICAKNLGIAKKIELDGYEIIRPLINYSKSELLAYNSEKKVPYSIDVSNLENSYERNRIRHSIVEKMSDEEKDKIVSEIKIEQHKNFELQNSEKLHQKVFSVDEFLALKKEEIQFAIINNLEDRNFYREMTKKFVEEIIKKIKGNKSTLIIPLIDDFSIVKSYGYLYFVKTKKYDGEITLNKGEKFANELYEIDFTKGAEDRNIKDEDYPLTIKVPNLKDKVKVGKYESQVNRLLIDWKVPLHVRLVWPAVYNKDGKIIYIPRYHMVYEDNHKSVFKIKISSYFGI